MPNEPLHETVTKMLLSRRGFGKTYLISNPPSEFSWVRQHFLKDTAKPASHPERGQMGEPHMQHIKIKPGERIGNVENNGLQDIYVCDQPPGEYPQTDVTFLNQEVDRHKGEIEDLRIRLAAANADCVEKDLAIAGYKSEVEALQQDLQDATQKLAQMDAQLNSGGQDHEG